MLASRLCSSALSCSPASSTYSGFCVPFSFARSPVITQVDIVAKVREVMLAHRGSERVKSACQGTIVSFEAELTKAKLHERYVVAHNHKFCLVRVLSDLPIDTRVILALLSFAHTQCGRSYHLACIAK